MRSVTKITLFTSGLVFLAVPAGAHKVLTLDIAVDCRTFVSGPNRGDAFIGNGKLFPAGTLPSGTAGNDPTQPVNEIAPIGDFLVRGQHAFPFPPEIAASYSGTPGDFATQYYILNDGRGLTAEGYAPPSLDMVLLSVTGGIGDFRGASGDVRGLFLGTNVTGSPNSRAEFTFVRRSVRGNSRDEVRQ
jgi:hypothetical protein